jgi:hypothetical protein
MLIDCRWANRFQIRHQPSAGKAVLYLHKFRVDLLARFQAGKKLLVI